MTAFRFESVDRDGRRRSGRVEAGTRAEALAAATAGGARVLKLDPVATTVPFWQRDLFGSGRISDQDRLAFVKDFSTLVGAELTIDRALRLVIRQAPKRLKKTLEGVLADVLAGVPLSRALGRRPEAFPVDMVEVVAAGELTGHLGRVLKDLTLSLERRLEIRRTIVSALIYPALLLVMALGVVALVVGVLVPSLAPLFDQPGAEPPMVIALVQGLQAVLAAWWPVILALLAGLTTLLAVAWRRPGFAAARERLLFATPLLGPVLVGIEAGRFTRVLGTLLSASVPVPAAIQATRRVPKSRAFRAAIDEAARRIPEGARLAAALGGLSRLSPLTLQMIATGEEVNRLPDMLLHAANLHEETVRLRIDRLFTVMTPVITGLLGVLIGSLILSIMGAILSINDLAGS